LAALQDAGFIATFLIGERGEPLQLSQRTDIARAAGASLFISLHHDSVQPKYLSAWMVKGRTQKYSDVFHGYSLFVSARNKHFAASREFAVLLGQALLHQGLTPSLHHAEMIPGEGRPLLDPQIGLYQFDDLVVLRTATMPAVLLESAIIVNRSEEERVRSGDYHRQVVAALVQASNAYCRATDPGSPQD
jgi:N-acetylmuramoyl-L-alanine amidase